MSLVGRPKSSLYDIDMSYKHKQHKISSFNNSSIMKKDTIDHSSIYHNTSNRHIIKRKSLQNTNSTSRLINKSDNYGDLHYMSAKKDIDNIMNNSNPSLNMINCINSGSGNGNNIIGLASSLSNSHSNNDNSNNGMTLDKVFGGNFKVVNVFQKDECANEVFPINPKTRVKQKNFEILEADEKDDILESHKNSYVSNK